MERLISGAGIYITEVVGLHEPKTTDEKHVEAKEFIAWAETDLKTTGRRGLGNALSNIKKGLHARVDEIVSKTHLRFAVDWHPKRMTTPWKLGVLQALGIGHEAIIDVMTEDRNEFEHGYTLPGERMVRLFLHAAQLWLEKSYQEHEFRPIGFVGLPLHGIGIGPRKPNGSGLGVVDFGAPKAAMFFCNSRAQLIKLAPDGSEECIDYKKFDMKQMLELEAKHIRRALAGGCTASLDEVSLIDLLERYRNWVRDYLAGKVQPRM